MGENKNLIIGLVVAAAIGLGGFLYMQNQGSSGSSLTASAPSAGGSSTALSNVGEVAPGMVPSQVPGVIGALSQDVLLAFAVSPANFNPVLAWGEGVYNSFAGTGAWKRLNLGEILKKSFMDGLKPDTEDGKAAIAMYNELSRWYTQINQISFIASKQKFPVVENIEAPMLMASVAFQEAANANEAYDRILSQVMQGKPTLQEGGLKLTKRADPEKAVDIEAGDPTGKVKIKGLFRLQGQAMELLVGTADSKIFLTDAADKRLVGSQIWSQIGHGSAPNAGIAMYVDTDSVLDTFEGVMDGVAKMMPPEGGVEQLAEVKKMFALQRGFGPAIASMSFDGGLRSSSCGLVKADSPAGKLLMPIVAARKPGGDNGFFRAIDERTIVAGQIQLTVLRMQLENFKRMRTQVPADVAQEPQFVQVEKVLKDLEEIDAKFKFSTLGLVVNTPIGGPIPSVGIFFGGSALSGEDLVARFADQWNSLAHQFGLPLPPAEVKDAPGGKRVEIPIQGTMTVIGGLVADNSLLFTVDPSLVEGVRNHLKSSKAFLDNYDLDKFGVKEGIRNGDFLMFVNTEGLIDMGKPYLPIAIAQQKAEPKVELGEAEEILNLLKSNLVISGWNHAPSPGVLCSEGRMTTLH
jgi:hypothetical protein